ncbi:MAG TPA: serine protease [Methylococcaceae bacterium]|jgi:S1-C subfamily serine protease|nr:serine protease [Methylococcaceae bacterium]
MRGMVMLDLVLCCLVLSVPAYAEVNYALAQSVVQIHAYSKESRVFLGSGVVVGPHRVATNCHVTRTARVIVVSKGPLRYRAVSQKADPKRDICILEAPGIQQPAATLGAASRLAVGEPVYVYGYPRAIGIAFSAGRIEALHPYEGSRVIETSADFAQGVSGGGLFDDSGRLIGLATFLSAGRSGHYYAIPADWIAALARAAFHKIEPLVGSPFWEDVSALPPFLRRPGQ